MTISGVLPGTDAKTYMINTVAGKPAGTAYLKQFASGDEMLVLEVKVPAGYHSPAHDHPHTSVGYMISGKVECEVDGKASIMVSGDVFVHPSHTMHRTRVIEDAVWIEIKSPAPTRRTDDGEWVREK